MIWFALTLATTFSSIGGGAAPTADDYTV